VESGEKKQNKIEGFLVELLTTDLGRSVLKVSK
jgi:hypothetical protein